MNKGIMNKKIMSEKPFIVYTTELIDKEKKYESEGKMHIFKDCFYLHRKDISGINQLQSDMLRKSYENTSLCKECLKKWRNNKNG